MGCGENYKNQLGNGMKSEKQNSFESVMKDESIVFVQSGGSFFSINIFFFLFNFLYIFYLFLFILFIFYLFLIFFFLLDLIP